jgi:predicted permease
MLGAASAAAGAGLAWLLVSAVRSFLPQAAFVSSLNTPDIDVRALGAASIAGVVATLGAGLLPAVLGTHANVSRLLQTAGRATPTGRARVATRALLVCQVALSCTLVFGATLLVRSFVNLVSEDRGLDVRNVLTAQVVFPAESFATPESRLSAAAAVEDAVRTVPGVTAVSWSYGTPPRGNVYSGEWTSDLPGVQPVNMLVYQFIVDRNFFDLYRVPVLRGRPFQPADDRTAVLVSERFAQALWPGQDPIGRRFTFAGSAPFENAQLQVIGLVRDIHFPSLERAIDDPEIYVPFSEPAPNVLAMLSFRCEATCPAPAQLRRRLSAAHPGVNILDVEPPESRYLGQFVRPRAAATLGSAFAVTALIAAAAGLFSLFSQSVAYRRREFGIRTALGATPLHVRRLVWSEGLTVTLLGIALGAFASILLTRVLSSLLFDVATTDPMSWAIVAVTLAAAIAAAAWHPTRSAVRAAPVALLREE